MSSTTALPRTDSQAVRTKFPLRDLLAHPNETAGNATTERPATRPYRDWIEKAGAAGLVLVISSSIPSSTETPIFVARDVLAAKHAETATSQSEESIGDALARTQIRRTIQSVLKHDELYQDGVESNLGIAMRVLFTKYPRETLTEISDALQRNLLPLETRAELIKALGRIRNGTTHDARLFLISEQLKHRIASVRDAAAIALYEMEDPRAIPYLRAAIAAESAAAFKADLEDIVGRLSAHV